MAVLAVVVQEDWSRVVWPSCPSQGWVSGVNRLSSLPNGNALVPQSKGNTIEVSVNVSDFVLGMGERGGWGGMGSA